MQAKQGGLGAWALMGVLALIWGSSFILMKHGLFDHGRPVLTPWQMAATRLSIAWLALSPLLLRHLGLLPRHWKALLATGLFGNGIPAFLFAIAQSHIGSAVAGMINSLTPLFVLVVGATFFNVRLRGVHLVGVALGLAGAAGLILQGNGVNGAPTFYAACAVVATICYGISANVVKHHLPGLPAAGISALALTFVGVPATVMVFATGVPGTVMNDPAGPKALLHVALLAVLSSALALVLWNRLIQLTTALAASTVTYLMPVIAIGWGLLDDEHITWAHLGLIGAILAGVLLVHLADRRSA